MVLVLGSALDMTLRDRNALLEAAGFTSAYRDEPLDAPEAAFTMERVRRELTRNPDDRRLRELLARVDAMADVPRGRVATTAAAGPFLSVDLRRGGLEARIFSTIATIGTPIDATAEEIAIETYFPADEATARLFRELAS